MKYTDVVEVVENLLPKVKDTQDPEGVIIKYAKENNLPPDIVEKIGHVYNTAKTVHFMNTNANRGDVFELINASDLKKSYKEASINEVTEYIGDTDGWFNMDKAASADMDDRGFGSLNEALASTESEEVEEVKVAGSRKDSWHFDTEGDLQANALDNFKDELIDNIHAGIAKVASTIRREGDWGEFESEALLLDNPYVKKACDHIFKDLEENKPAFSDTVYERTTKKATLIYDDLGLIGDLKNVSRDLQILENLDDYATEKLAVTVSSSPNAKKVTGWNEDVEDVSNALQTQNQLQKSIPGQGRSQSKPRPPKNNGDVVDADVEDLGSGPSVVDAINRRRAEDKDRDKRVSQSIDDVSAAGGQVMDFADTVRKAPGQLASGVMDGIRPLMDRAKNTIEDTNNRQKNLDTDEDNLIFKTSLERLIHTDPIISEADPKTVASIANTIRSGSPDVAGDINTLRYLIRESLQYESVPIHAYKDLTSINKEKVDAAEKGKRLDDDKYRIQKRI